MTQMSFGDGDPAPIEWEELEFDGRRFRWGMGPPGHIAPPHWPDGFELEVWHRDRKAWIEVRLWRTKKSVYEHLSNTNRIQE